MKKYVPMKPLWTPCEKDSDKIGQGKLQEEQEVVIINYKELKRLLCFIPTISGILKLFLLELQVCNHQNYCQF